MNVSELLNFADVIRDFAESKTRKQCFLENVLRRLAIRYTCIGTIANIYSLCNLTFNLAIKTVNVGLCWAHVKLNSFYTCNTVVGLQYYTKYTCCCVFAVKTVCLLY